jgi:undecaprenyl-diphosphatase
MTTSPHAAQADPSEQAQQAVHAAAIARHRAVVGLVVAAATAALLTWAVTSGGAVLAGFDDAVTTFTRGWADRLGWPVEVANVVGEVTAPVRSALVGVVLVVILLLVRQPAAAGWIAASGIAGVLTSEAVKYAVGRERPPGAEQYEPDMFKSFPSGHAMVGIYLYLVAGLVLVHIGRARERRWVVGLGGVLVAMGPLIGLTRLVLGVHWPSDLIAGWAFGSTVALASALLLWWPLHRGWAPQRTRVSGAVAGPVEPPEPAPDQLP